MNKDFHYYGTYMAAKIAGMGEIEAQKIAFYAQFVDECTKEVAEKLVKDTSISPVYTVQSGYELFKLGINPEEFKDVQLEILEPIWTVFHFLPGGGKERMEHRKELICKPNSETVLNMVKHLIETSNNNPLRYAHIGLIMHILADTWAHREFAGIPSKTLNDMGTVYDEDQKEIHFVFVNGNICTNWMPRENASAYLGHGRIGHLPDYGYRKYSYTNRLGETIEKNNPEEFKKAFEQMIYVMKCIQNPDEIFSEDKFKKSIIESEEERDVLAILCENVSTEEICKRLDSYIKQYNKSNGIPTYSHDDFFAGGQERTSLREFFRAAREHRAWVLERYPSINC